MNKRARIISITPNNRGDWASVDVVFDNGDKGNQLLGKVSENKQAWFKEGDEVEYTAEARQGYPDKLKINRPNQETRRGGGKSDEASKVATMILSYSKDLVVAGKSDNIEAASERLHQVFMKLYQSLKMEIQ